MLKFEKIQIFYFSGTGNAKQITRWLQKFASEKKIGCEVLNIAKIPGEQIAIPDNSTLIIIISPIHGFNYPKITLQFIAHFPKGNNSVVLMNTRAGMKIGRFVTPGLTGIAFMLASIVLKRKGYKIKGQIPFDMPSNWISVHPALNDKTVKYLHRENYKRVEKHARIIFSGKTDFHSNRDIVQDILISPIALGYYFFGRFAFAKSFYASVACDDCGLCIKQCPVKAIKLVHNHPYWTFNCESCMKCMNNCPKYAIETAHGLFVIVSVLGSSLTTFILHSLVIGKIPHELIRFLAGTIIFFSLLWFFYKLQQLLLQNKFVGKCISYLSLTHYKFWGRYKSIPDKQWK